MRLRFYRVLERVRDQIQHKYFGERGLGRGANGEGIIKGTGTSLEGGACECRDQVLANITNSLDEHSPPLLL